MKPVFHKPMDGQCVRACVASILELRLDQVPNFQCEGHHWDAEQKAFTCSVPEHLVTYEIGGGKTSIRYSCDSAYDQRDRVRKFVGQFGFTYSEMRMNDRHRETGPTQHNEYRRLPPGICVASGRSPRFDGSHVVVWDTRLIDFEHPYGRMIHDPAPQPEGERAGVGMIEEFFWMEMIDTDKLAVLVALQNEVKA